MKRSLSLILAGILLASLAGCGGDSPEVQTDTGTENTTAPAETEPAYAPMLPDTDMSGETYTIFTTGWYSYAPLKYTDIAPEEQNGEALNDAAFKRVTAVEEKFGCDIVWAEYDDHQEGNDAFIRSVSAGDDDFDIAQIRGTHYYNLVTMGALTDLETVPHLDLDKPYYDQTSLEITSVKGTPYGIVSDLSINHYLTTASIFANLQLIEDYSLGNIFETVWNGDWTLDKMFEMGALHEADLDNNGVYDNQDRYTVTYINNSTPAYLTASGIKLAEVSKDSIELTFDSEINMDKLIKIISYFLDTNKSYYYHARSTDTADEHNMFKNRHSLFHTGAILHATLFRDMEDDFAILPLPKLEKEQDGYYSSVTNDTLPLTAIPTTNSRLENTGILVEQLAYLGKRDLYPQMYEIVLKTKIARDENCTKMIDTVFENVVYDAGIFYFNNLYSSIQSFYRNANSDYASTFASLRPSLETAAKELFNIAP